MRRRPSTPLALCALAVWGSGACGPRSDATEAPNVLPTWRISDTVALAIGEVEGDEAYVLSRVADVALLDGGGVAVADGGSATIRVYRPDGTVRTIAGGPGDGPGEFRWINDLRYRPPDTLVVFDAEAGRLTTLAENGERVGSTVTFRADDGRVEIYLGRFGDGGHALAWIRQPPTERNPAELTPDMMAIARFGPDGRYEAPLVEDLGMRRLGCCPTPFSPSFAGAVLGGAVLHTDGMRPEVRRTGTTGEPLPPLRLPVARGSLADAWAAYRPHADSSDLVRFDEIRGAAGLDSVPAFSDMMLDDEGRPWLKEYDPSVDSHWRLRPRTGGHWIVIRADGTPVARVSVPGGFRPMDVRGSAVAGITRDGLGVERVEVRFLDRRPDG
jgi:hypothetical protein